MSYHSPLDESAAPLCEDPEHTAVLDGLDLDCFFNYFGTNFSDRIRICRSYASYLAAAERARVSTASEDHPPQGSPGGTPAPSSPALKRTRTQRIIE